MVTINTYGMTGESGFFSERTIILLGTTNPYNNSVVHARTVL